MHLGTKVYMQDRTVVQSTDQKNIAGLGRSIVV